MADPHLADNDALGLVEKGQRLLVVLHGLRPVIGLNAVVEAAAAAGVGEL